MRTEAPRNADISKARRVAGLDQFDLSWMGSAHFGTLGRVALGSEQTINFLLG